MLLFKESKTCWFLFFMALLLMNILILLTILIIESKETVTKCFLPRVSITNYNILINDRNVYDLSTGNQFKNYDEIGRRTTRNFWGKGRRLEIRALRQLLCTAYTRRAPQVNILVFFLQDTLKNANLNKNENLTYRSIQKGYFFSILKGTFLLFSKKSRGDLFPPPASCASDQEDCNTRRR